MHQPMALNKHIDRVLKTTLRGKEYSVEVSGKGRPCLAIGIGSLMQRTLSDTFKKAFQVYSSDLYWDSRYRLESPKQLTFQQIIDDLKALVDSLKLSSLILVAHSAYGIVALEYAKRYQVDGVIMIGTPVNSNTEVAAINNRCFELEADPIRKKIDQERRFQYSKEVPNPDPAARFLREYIWRDAPRYWHDPAFDCTSLWEGVPIDGEVLDHFFGDLLPNVDVRKNLESIQCPVFLAAGMSDFDCCPWLWAKVENLPHKFTLSIFEKSGHYPHYEEEALFDDRIKAWMRVEKKSPQVSSEKGKTKMQGSSSMDQAIEKSNQTFFSLRSMQLDLLKNRPEAIPTLADWLYEEWGPYDASLTKEKLIRSFHERLRGDGIPIAFVVVEKDKPVACISLKKLSDPEFSDFPKDSIWIGSLYVGVENRRKGIGQELMKFAAAVMKNLGYETLYFYTSNPNNVAWYLQGGAKVIETRPFRGHHITLMQRQLE